jgi:triosephosphate isomerase (TIM)
VNPATRAWSGRRPLMAGNWKMHLNHLEAIALVQKLAFSLPKDLFDDIEVAVLPPFTDIRSVQTLVDGDKLPLRYGAQDISPHKPGAFTGEIAGSMLTKLGCTYVIVGHSERRHYHGEDDNVVNAKAKAAHAVGLTPIVCVGEGTAVRDRGGHVVFTTNQLDAALTDLDPAAVRDRLVVAYEPVWAIGTGKVASPEDAQEVCAGIRKRLADHYSPNLADQVRILYGGSVKAANIAPLMDQPDIDGALVGSASIDAEEFAAICRYRDHLVPGVPPRQRTG